MKRLTLTFMSDFFNLAFSCGMESEEKKIKLIQLSISTFMPTGPK